MTDTIIDRLRDCEAHEGENGWEHMARVYENCDHAADYIERLEAQLEDAANSGAWETGYNRGHTDALEEAAKTEEER